MAASQELLCLFSCLTNFCLDKVLPPPYTIPIVAIKAWLQKDQGKEEIKGNWYPFHIVICATFGHFHILKKKKRTTSKMSCIEMIKKTGEQRNLKNSRMCIVSWLLSWKASFLAEHCVYSPANFLGYWKSNGCFGKYMHRS